MQRCRKPGVPRSALDDTWKCRILRRPTILQEDRHSTGLSKHNHRIRDLAGATYIQCGTHANYLHILLQAKKSRGHQLQYVTIPVIVKHVELINNDDFKLPDRAVIDRCIHKRICLSNSASRCLSCLSNLPFQSYKLQYPCLPMLFLTCYLRRSPRL